MSFLKKLEELIGKEAFDKVKKEIGDKDLILNDGNYIPKQKFNDQLDEIKTLKAEKEKLDIDLKTAQADLKKLTDDDKSKKTTVEQKLADLDKKILDAENKIAAKDKELLLAKKENVLKDALTGAGVKNPKNLKLLLKEIDLEKLEVDADGKIKGFDDRVKLLQQDYKALFGEEKLSGVPPTDGDGTKPNADKEVSSEEFYQGIFSPKK
jgi:hypothetical protein